jgi:hypothetical protein
MALGLQGARCHHPPRGPVATTAPAPQPKRQAPQPTPETAIAPFTNPAVEAKFAAYPREAKKALLELREIILLTAASTPGVGEIEETLKWGEPAYVTKNGAGSTVRIDWKAKRPEQYSVFFHCQTDLVHRFRTMFPNDFEFEGNRALTLRLGENIPKDALALCLAAALTYHLGARSLAKTRTGAAR